MKSYLTFSLTAVLGLFLLSSCDKDIFDITETFTFEHEFVVFENDDSFQEFVSINMSQKETLIEQYGSKIKKIDIEEVKYHLRAHNGSSEQKLVNFTLKSANPDGSDAITIVQLQDVVLSDLLNNPTVLNVNSQGIQKLNNLIEKSPHTFGLKLEAEIDETPADFTVVFSFKTKMTANPLN